MHGIAALDTTERPSHTPLIRLPDQISTFLRIHSKRSLPLEEAENGVRDLADDVAGEEATALITVVVLPTSDSDMGPEPAPGVRGRG